MAHFELKINCQIYTVFKIMTEYEKIYKKN
jgi:hypothetical protein